MDCPSRRRRGHPSFRRHLRRHDRHRHRGRHRPGAGPSRSSWRVPAPPSAYLASEDTAWPASPRSRPSGDGPPTRRPTSAGPSRSPRPSIGGAGARAGHVLVNNAAANFPVLAASMRPNAFRSVTDIVLDGTFFCSQELHRRLAPRGAAGDRRHSATQSFTGGPGMAHNAAAKAGSATSPSRRRWSGRRRHPRSTRSRRLFSNEDMRNDLKALRPEGESVDARRSRRAGSVGSTSGLGRHLALLGLRGLRHGPHAGGGRGQLAAPRLVIRVHAGGGPVSQVLRPAD